VSALLDTSIVVDVLRQHGSALKFTGSLDESPTCSELTRVEIMKGLRSAERSPTEILFRTFTWIGVDESIARRAGELGRIYRRSHSGIGIPDLIIAATAQELGLELATMNVRHFPMFKGLRAPYRD